MLEFNIYVWQTIGWWWREVGESSCADSTLLLLLISTDFAAAPNSRPPSKFRVGIKENRFSRLNSNFFVFIQISLRTFILTQQRFFCMNLKLYEEKYLKPWHFGISTFKYLEILTLFNFKILTLSNFKILTLCSLAKGESPPAKRFAP